MRVIGLMSGTSIDAVDAAVVDIATRAETLELSLLGSTAEQWPPELRDRIRPWSDTAAAAGPGELAEASMAIGELFAVATRSAAAAAGLDLESIDLVCSHGQTVHHLIADDGRALATLQLGQPAVIAERTGRTVVADFRPRDIAAGGHGAPLVSFVDALLLGEEGHTVAALNLGGIANVTVVPARRPLDSIAFDTGPGNSLIDAAARRLLGQAYDRDGAAAAAGEPSEELLVELLAEPYFDRRPPKSTGRELFGDAFAAHTIERGRSLELSDNDVLATLTELTARSVALALAAFAPAWPAVVHASGGGTLNPTLMRHVEQALRRDAPAGAEPAQLRPLEEATGIPSAAKEALAFAVLGHEALHGRPNSLPGATGARHSSVLGAIWPGSNYRHLVELVDRGQATAARVEGIVVTPSATRGKGKG